MAYTDIMEQVLNENPEVDGIFASSDGIGAEVFWCCANRGIRVPEQIKVVGFDNLPFWKILIRALLRLCRISRALEEPWWIS